MPDIGFGEIIVIIVIALLVFGPDRLPKVAADAARTLRQVREMAASARKDLVDASGLDGDDDISQAVRDIRDLDPRRAVQGVFDDPITAADRGAKPTATGAAGVAGGAAGASPGRASGAPVKPAGPGAAGGATGAALGSGTKGPGSPVGSAGAAAEPVADPVADATPVDPDWT